MSSGTSAGLGSSLTLGCSLFWHHVITITTMISLWQVLMCLTSRFVNDLHWFCYNRRSPRSLSLCSCIFISMMTIWGITGWSVVILPVLTPEECAEVDHVCLLCTGVFSPSLPFSDLFFTSRWNVVRSTAGNVGSGDQREVNISEFNLQHQFGFEISLQILPISSSEGVIVVEDPLNPFFIFSCIS